MKINLLRNSQNTINGFLNIDPFSQGEPDKVMGDLTNLDQFCEDAEATIIVADDIIDFFDKSVIDRAISNWVKKLRHNGTLIIGGVDLIDVSKGVASYAISVEVANLLLHGSHKQPWDMRKNTMSLVELCNLLRSKGLKIESARSNAFMMSVKAVRE